MPWDQQLDSFSKLCFIQNYDDLPLTLVWEVHQRQNDKDERNLTLLCCKYWFCVGAYLRREAQCCFLGRPGEPRPNASASFEVIEDCKRRKNVVYRIEKVRLGQGPKGIVGRGPCGLSSHHRGGLFKRRGLFKGIDWERWFNVWLKA